MININGQFGNFVTSLMSPLMNLQAYIEMLANPKCISHCDMKCKITK
jgi:hypothetical protein